MAVPVPRTWVVGEVVTAAFMNGLRDALNFLLNPPTCHVTHSLDQSTSDGVEKTLAFDTERKDTDTMHSSGSNTLITATTPGYCDGRVNVGWASGATGIRLLRVYRNGTSQIISSNRAAGAAGTWEQQLVWSFQLGAGDNVRTRVTQTSGTTVNISQLSDYSPEFTARWCAA